MLRRRCLQKMLFHHAARLWKRSKVSVPRTCKFENYDIGKYLESAEKLSIRITSLGFGTYELRKGSITRRLMSNLCLDTENVVTYRLCGNKYLTYRVLLENGIRCVPRHEVYTFNQVEKTCKDFLDWQCPVVIKPCSGTSGGNGVTVNVRTLKELKNAICESYMFDRRAYLMEQFIEGSHFRVVTLKGEFAACVQRMPARIIGNGRDSIRTLIERENARRRKSAGEGALHPILIDNEVHRKLASMGGSMRTVLRADEEIFVRDTINFHAGGEQAEIDHVCDDVKRICGQIAEILDIYLAGFDIITNDIHRPLDHTHGVINEVNTSPGTEQMYTVREAGTRMHLTELVLRDMFHL